ncbi:ferritin-like domain-containing protein [Saccharopolyspora sp. NPDC050389]|uniref:ferritin-like domain-containing protein n=1 Tax=Saccharopolyspora sp. NPDC050389 TaxID=3155516 RepID=UPI0033D707AE
MTELSEEAGNALRSALSAEHAAVWVYGLASAFVSEPRVRSAIGDAMEQHRRLRDTAERVIREAQQTPPAAQPAYDIGEPVGDQKAAIGLLVKAESDCEIGWRSVLENTSAEEAALRGTALDGLTTAAVRATRWRLTIGTQPAAKPFPGQP